MFQKVVLPLLPALHGGNGLIAGGDSILFHKIAVSLADSIRLHGWSNFSLTPSQGITGNVPLLACLYAVFGVDPAVIIPVNAAVHATSGIFIFLISQDLWPGRVGVYSGIIAASLFIAFPSALNWYGQIHKDGFAILGMLVIFYSWVRASRYSWQVRTILRLVLSNLAGLLLIVFVRPYNVMLLVLSAAIVSLISFIYFAATGKLKKMAILALIVGLFLGALGIVNAYVPKHWVTEKQEMLLGLARSKGIDWHWDRSPKVPPALDRIAENAAVVRVVNIYHGREMRAGSLMDENIRPGNFWSSLAYLPKAAFIALFAPFPNRWLKGSGVVNLVSVGETVLWYVLVPGVCLALWYRRSPALVLLAVNALVFLTVLGLTNPNLGTLYRFRYVYLFIFILIGIMGWMELLRRKFGERIKRTSFRRRDPDIAANQNSVSNGLATPYTRSMVSSAGFAVMFFTLIGNILLVARDVVLARWFGLGNELDAFFIAMTVPMFLVSVISIPIGTVTIPPLIGLFQKGSKADSREFISLCSTAIFCVMLFFTLLLYLTGKIYIPVIGWGFSPEKIALSHRILMMILPILFFSGFVILGNSILNARQKFALPALAQAIVPIVAIFALTVAAEYAGIYAMAVGMVAGQIANLLIVSYYVNKEGYSFYPRVFSSRFREYAGLLSVKLRGLISEYVPLVLAALFLGLALPVNNMMAASLAPGSVSAFNLGFKFILFFTGLVGTGISTVMLPHFSHYFAGNRVSEARHELSFFVISTMLISIALTVLISSLSPLIVKCIFYGGLFSTRDTTAVTKIMEYGLLQMPFFCIGMIMMKYANARRKNIIVMISSLSGLIVNVILNFIFMRTMGIPGIALATSLSVIFATGFFVISGYRRADITRHDFVFLVLTTLLYLMAFLYNYYLNVLGIMITAIVLFITIILRFNRSRACAEGPAGQC